MAGHIKLWEDLLSSIKVRRLSDSGFRFWIQLIISTNSAGGIDGEIPPLDEICLNLSESKTVVKNRINELVRFGLLYVLDADRSIGGMPYKIHDWVHWQVCNDPRAAERQARWRKRNAEKAALRNGVARPLRNAYRNAKVHP